MSQPTPKLKGCDPKCYDLAIHFLRDHYDNKVPVLMAQELADAIQQAVEEWLEGEGLGEGL